MFWIALTGMLLLIAAFMKSRFDDGNDPDSWFARNKGKILLAMIVYGLLAGAIFGTGDRSGCHTDWDGRSNRYTCD